MVKRSSKSIGKRESLISVFTQDDNQKLVHEPEMHTRDNEKTPVKIDDIVKNKDCLFEIENNIALKRRGMKDGSKRIQSDYKIKRNKDKS